MIARPLRDYAAVSGFCLLLNNVILVTLDRVGTPLPMSIGLSFVILVVVGYLLHSRVSFHCALTAASFLRYAIAMSANIPSALAMLWLWRDLVGLGMELAAPISSVCMALLNFSFCRFAVFGRPRSSSEIS